MDKLITVHEMMSSDDGKILVRAGAEQAASKSIIVRSTDGGATWVERDFTKSGLPSSTEGITRRAMNPGNPDDFILILRANGYSSTPVVWRKDLQPDQTGARPADKSRSRLALSFRALHAACRWRFPTVH